MLAQLGYFIDALLYPVKQVVNGLASGAPGVRPELAEALDARLIRLQCYEGLDAHSAMYEWNYQRQLLAIKLLERDERLSKHGDLDNGIDGNDDALLAELLCRPRHEMSVGDGGRPNDAIGEGVETSGVGELSLRAG